MSRGKSLNPFFFIFPNFCKFSFLLANLVLTLDFYSICDWLSSVIGWVRHLANTNLKSKNLSLKCFLVMWCNSEAASNWSLLSRNEFSKMTAKVFIKMQLIISSKKTKYHPALFHILNQVLTPQGHSSERNLPGTIVPWRDIFDKW